MGIAVEVRSAGIALVVVLACLLLLTGWANFAVMRERAFSHDRVEELPVVHACLVLGTSPHLVDGRPNRYFAYRMEAAGELYRAGKCAKLVVSGLRDVGYDEPREMKRALVTLGVPAADIVCDSAGVRTLDSVTRFALIFGQHSGIVVSQAFHNARAIYIARAHGVELSGYNARDVEAYDGLRTGLREILARVRAFIDVRLLHSQPQHGGEPIPI